jgi:thiosulfate reductase cytochrome b subunit
MMHHGFKRYLGLAVLVLVLGALLMGTTASAQGGDPLHPTIPLLDEDGNNVLDTGKPVSTMKTCGGCHDTQFIEEHNFHSQQGRDHLYQPGQAPSGRPWDISEGLFGQWDPVIYRYLSPSGDKLMDLGTPDWVKVFGRYHPGGGPATTSRLGLPLQDLHPTANNPETNSYDPATNEATLWDWDESGVVEMNCFLCHTADPNNEARIKALEEGQFAWADTATLLGTGIVSPKADGEGFEYNEDLFDEEKHLKHDAVPIQSATSDNCGLCHGVVQTDTTQPLSYDDLNETAQTTMRTGQIFSGQRISDSALNIKNKDMLERSWDVHAERNLKCTDCHYSINNPAYYEPPQELRPEHLTFEPRRPDIADYLERPSHQFARGAVTKGEVGTGISESMRRCESCHNYKDTHDWLPYVDRHGAKLSCEACHVPQLHAPAIQQNDWTVVDNEGNGIINYRGIDGNGNPKNPYNLISGYQPVLMPRYDEQGNAKLAPFNLLTTWYWMYGDPARPVRQADLRKAFLTEDGAYKQEILAAFDSDGDGQLSKSELRLDTDEKQNVVKSQLEALGLDNPRITGEILPYYISHDVAYGKYATKDCKACHSDESRVSEPLMLSDYTPGGVTPHLVQNINVEAAGDFVTGEDGALYYQPSTSKAGLYLPGHDRVVWIDWLGILMMLGVLAGVAIHGGLRIFTAAHGAATHHGPTRKLYLYTFYERLWHWTQAIAIILLILTGTVIHRPDLFGSIDLGAMVPVHNVLGFLLMFNAFFALFYFIAGHTIQQFLPEPKGFFHQALQQAMYYGHGIFKGDPHPFEKDERRKMNPLQQATYLAILNVLLPLQIITGILIWGAQRWPSLSDAIGGLQYIAPFHTLIAWTFAAFVIMHMYLTTTGHTPLAAVEGMITGWEEVEIEEPHDGSGMTTA